MAVLILAGSGRLAVLTLVLAGRWACSWWCSSTAWLYSPWQWLEGWTAPGGAPAWARCQSHRLGCCSRRRCPRPTPLTGLRGYGELQWSAESHCELGRVIGSSWKSWGVGELQRKMYMQQKLIKITGSYTRLTGVVGSCEVTESYGQ